MKLPDHLFEIVASSGAQWFGAAATLLAVLVALFKDSWSRWWRRPQLAVRIEPSFPDCLFSPWITPMFSGSAYWLRLWIANKGNVRAEQVQVFVSNLYKRDLAGKFIAVDDFPPMNLRWANSKDWKNPEIFAPGISHKMGKHCDLLAIIDPDRPSAPAEVGELQLEQFPASGKNLLGKGTYILSLIVGAANADPVSVFLELTLDGAWSPDPDVMLHDHVGIKIVKRPKNIPK